MKKQNGARRLGHQRVRTVIQVTIVLFVALLAFGHDRDWSWAAGIHTVCPFGGVANLYTYFTTGGFVAKLHDAVFVVLLALLAGLLLTGKSFCGWICPLGSIQEFLGRLGRRLWPSLFGRVPPRLDGFLLWGKWAVLLLVLVQTARTAKLFFQPYDPYYNLFNIWSDELAWTGYLVAGLTVGASLFVDRPFCRYACPLGALNGLFNSFSALTLRRDTTVCTDCGRCNRVCPAGVSVSRSATVRSLECTRCLACVEACPVNSKGGAALVVEPLWRRLWAGRPLPAAAFFSVAILAFAAPIGATSLAGDFNTETEHVYETPDDIRGSSPLADIIENFGLSRDELYNGFGLPPELDPQTKLKDVQAALGLPEGSEVVVPEYVRAAVAALDVPLAALVEDGSIKEELLPALSSQSGGSEGAGAAVNPDWTMRQVMAQAGPGTAAYLLSGRWPVVGASGPEQAEAPTNKPAAEVPPGESAVEGEPPAIRGVTTLDEVEPLVADFPAFLEEFGIAENEPGTAQLKDLSGRYGFEVSAVREYVAAE